MNSVKKFFLTSVALCSIALFSMPTVIKAMTDQQNIINSVRIDVDASSNIVLTADELVIEISRHEYTPEYISLTKDFYIKM